MILDYNPARSLFVLHLPRGEGDPNEYQTVYGLDFYKFSPPHEALLSTREPYAAATFWQHATPLAREQLGGIITEIEASWAPDHARHIAVPADKELWPFQRASCDYVLRRSNALIGDEPGLGKTQIAIACSNEMQAQRNLVVCPASIRYQWVRRIREWSTMETGLVYAVTSSKYGVHPEAEWTVISWELARNPAIHRALLAQKFDVLITDEVHYAKNISSQRSRAVFGYYDDRTAITEDQIVEGLAERSEHVIAMSGTPLPKRPREAYVVCRALCHDAIDWMAEKPFRERFNPMQQGKTKTGKVFVDERVGREAELQNRLRANLMVRHLKREVMTQLKMPIYDMIYVEDTAAVKQALEAERLLDLDGHLDVDAVIPPDQLGPIASARRLMGVAMAPQVADYVKMLIEGGEEKLVVFAWHVEVLDVLVAALLNFGVVRIDGKDSARSKEAKVLAFAGDPKRNIAPRPDVRIILGNVMSLGTGTDGLQWVANHALLAEPDWTHGNNVQCFDRLDRGGQNRTVQGDVFVARNSLSEKVLAKALVDAQIIHQALDKRPGGK